MLNKGRISAVLCSTDLARSQEFYEQKVGLTLSPETIPNHLLFESSDGSTVLVYGRPAPNQADHTQVRFWSTDVERDVKDHSSPGGSCSRTTTSRTSRPSATSRRPPVSAGPRGSRIPTATRSHCSSRSSRS